jgi:hypothetical protein
MSSTRSELLQTLASNEGGGRQFEMQRTNADFAATVAAIIMGNMFFNGFILLGVLTWLFNLGIKEIGAGFVVYFIYCTLSKASVKGGSWAAFRRSASVWEPLIRYFDQQVLAEPLPETGGPYIFCMHPHAIHGLGMMQLMYEKSQLFETVPGYKRWADKCVGLVATVLFYIPYVREIFLWGGYREVSRHSATRALREGNSVYLIVGGEAESLLSHEGTDKVVVAGHRRKGFVKLALQNGCPLVPCYMFGNTDTFHTSYFLFGFRKWLSKRFQICLPIFWGRWLTPTPFNVRLTIGFGAPVPLPEGYTMQRHADAPQIPAEVVDRYHEAYIASLEALFEKHKAAAGYPPSRKLEILHG